ncbi:protein C16orf58 family protein [Acanthamoeba castellanii str. Neff]|uniref:Protein C16orf58 family protein n=1 Tax=Acanthamoeba castellanii (strain ATCC 30010 / Neff) TaxID=1257118 RepID=L8H6L0_ACACF|nr:protein C16orf58 family protein [Acanthamoeba castellanii str. Neff]ELR20790.1 protein C16orf58 family protein [Acanthamoeba castellanii str. Neff]
MKGVRGGGATARRRGWWQDVLLPEGYPESVSGDYATYQTWDTVQALCSSITGLLCTRALLQGVGVGDVGATPGAAAVQWALRDGAGMVGRIGFAWLQALGK